MDTAALHHRIKCFRAALERLSSTEITRLMELVPESRDAVAAAFTMKAELALGRNSYDRRVIDDIEKLQRGADAIIQRSAGNEAEPILARLNEAASYLSGVPALDTGHSNLPLLEAAAECATPKPSTSILPTAKRQSAHLKLIIDNSRETAGNRHA